MNVMFPVDRDKQSCKFWLEPVGLTRNLGFNPKELRTGEVLVIEHTKNQKVILVVGS